MSRASLTLLASLSLGLALTACGDDSGGGAGETDTDLMTDSVTETTDPTTGNPTTTGPTTETSTTGSSSTTDPTVADTGSETTDPTVGETEGETETTGTTGDGTYFRVNSLQVRDPHVFSPIDGDVTQGTVNDPLTMALNTDEDDDGNLDLGLAMAFLPLDQTDAASEVFRFANAVCTAEDPSSCSLIVDTIPFDGMYTVTGDGECYAADAGNLSVYDEPPGAPTPTTGPCFRSDIGTVTIAAGTFTLPLQDAVVAAQFMGDPADGLIEGNIEGFVSTATADGIQIETGNPIIPMIALGALLQEEDQDEGGTGWVFHISFTATAAEWME